MGICVGSLALADTCNPCNFLFIGEVLYAGQADVMDW